LLKTYDPHVRELAQKLRRLVKKTLPGAAETVKVGESGLCSGREESSLNRQLQGPR